MKDIKVKIFALYWNQEVMKHPDAGLMKVSPQTMWSWGISNGTHLLLTSLSNISDEDAIEVGKMLYDYFRSPNGLSGDEYFLKTGKDWIDNYINGKRNYLIDPVVDYLRNGTKTPYALPAFNLSVQQQIDQGIIKIRD